MDSLHLPGDKVPDEAITVTGELSDAAIEALAALLIDTISDTQEHGTPTDLAKRVHQPLITRAS